MTAEAVFCAAFFGKDFYHEKKYLSFMRDCFSAGNGVLCTCGGFVQTGTGNHAVSDHADRKYFAGAVYPAGSALGLCGRADRIQENDDHLL